jgi:hypothetical protein
VTSAPSPSACASGGTTSTPPSSCTAHEAPWAVRHDGTNVPGPLVSRAGESTVTLPDGTVEPMSNFREFGPWSCRTASRGGIIRTIGLFLRRVIAGF